MKISVGHEFNGAGFYPWQGDPAGYVRMYQNLNQIANEEAQALGAGRETYPFFQWKYGTSPHGISGTVYTDAGTTAAGAGANIKVSCNGRKNG